MRKSRMAMALVVALAWPGEALPAEPDRVELTITRGGNPASAVEVALSAANLGKTQVLGTTDSRGQLSFALDAANLGKARVQVVEEECPSKSRVWLLGPGGKLPPEPRGCKRRVAGVFTWERVRLGLDLSTAALTIRPESTARGGRRGNRYFLPGVALAGTGAILTLYGFGTHGLEEGCTEADVERAPSCKKSRSGIGVVGLVMMGAGGTLLYLGRGKARAEIALVPGGVMVRKTIRF